MLLCRFGQNVTAVQEFVFQCDWIRNVSQNCVGDSVVVAKPADEIVCSESVNLMLLLMLHDQGMSFSVDEIICANFNG